MGKGEGGQEAGNQDTELNLPPLRDGKLTHALKLPVPGNSVDIEQYMGGRSLQLHLAMLVRNAADNLRAMLVVEREQGNLFHFAPLLLALGIITYFSAGSEPVFAILILSTLASAFIAIRARSHNLLWLIACSLALFFGGMSVGKMRTMALNTKPLTHQVTGIVSGTIIEVSRNQRGSPRYLLKTISIEGIDTSDLPTLIRLSAASKHEPGRPGDRITGLARLRAVSGPSFPGSFDFSFNAWYNQLGGSGFFMGKPQITPSRLAGSDISLLTGFQIWANRIRAAIASRIQAVLQSENGAVAVALIVGDRTGISRETSESLRNSGLAHVLAISGMHMALVSLTMVWAIRALLAFNQKLALTRAIKNWAVLAGFVTSTSYLAISGMSLATQRAWIMISIMILAALLNRKSITLRGVAIAALVILVLQPEALLSPGFQMSFAAVAAIVAAYEWWEEQQRSNGERRNYHPIIRFFFTLMITSLIAGIATSLFAAYHFHRVAPLGVVTNLLAMPIISIIVMPMALLSVLLMPYGLEQLALVPMGVGIGKVIEISNYVNSFGARGVSGQLGKMVLPLSFGGLFLLTMLKSKLRLGGIVMLAAIVFFWRGAQVPDVLLSEDGRAIAVRTQENRLALMYPRRNKFVRDIWLRAYSDDQASDLPVLEDRAKKEAGASEQLSGCDKDICVAKTVQGAVVMVVYAPNLLESACNQADILLAPRLRWVNCYGRQPLLIIRRGQLEEFGSHAIYLTGLKTPRAVKSSGGEGKNNNPSILLEDILEQEIAETLAPISEAKVHGDSEEPKQFRNKYENPYRQSEEKPPGAHLTTQYRMFEIERVEKAVIGSARPWNRHRAGRADYLQD